MMLHVTTDSAARSGLTRPASSGISHAHAGLAKLRPPLTPTISIAFRSVAAGDVAYYRVSKRGTKRTISPSKQGRCHSGAELTRPAQGGRPDDRLRDLPFHGNPE